MATDCTQDLFHLADDSEVEIQRHIVLEESGSVVCEIGMNEKRIAKVVRKYGDASVPAFVIPAADAPRGIVALRCKKYEDVCSAYQAVAKVLMN